MSWTSRGHVSYEKLEDESLRNAARVPVMRNVSVLGHDKARRWPFCVSWPRTVWLVHCEDVMSQLKLGAKREEGGALVNEEQCS